MYIESLAAAFTIKKANAPSDAALGALYREIYPGNRSWNETGRTCLEFSALLDVKILSGLSSRNCFSMKSLTYRGIDAAKTPVGWRYVIRAASRCSRRFIPFDAEIADAFGRAALVPPLRVANPGTSFTWSMLPKLGCDSLYLFTEGIPFFERKGVMDRETP
jgi:hypothetical protein